MINGLIKELMRHFKKEQSFCLSSFIIAGTGKWLFILQAAFPFLIPTRIFLTSSQLTLTFPMLQSARPGHRL